MKEEHSTWISNYESISAKGSNIAGHNITGLNWMREMDDGAQGEKGEEEGLFEYVYTPPLWAVGGSHYYRRTTASDTTEHAAYPSHTHKQICTLKQRDYSKNPTSDTLLYCIPLIWFPLHCTAGVIFWWGFTTYTYAWVREKRCMSVCIQLCVEMEVAEITYKHAHIISHPVQSNPIQSVTFCILYR